MKNKKVSFNQYIISLIAVAIIAIIGTYLVLDKQVRAIQAENKVQETTLTSNDLKKIDTLYSQIKANYVGKVSKTKLINGALKGMTSALDDPYTVYMDSTESEDLNNTISSSFEGIGATLSLQNELPTIAQAPIKGSPAEKANLKAGDVIMKIDGQSTKGQTLTQDVSKIRGKKGTSVTLNIQRGDENFDVKITRDTIPVDTVYANIDATNKEVGNIKITTFSENTYTELKTAIKKLRKEGAKSFVLDVRQNPGGLLDQVEKMASMFLKDGQTIVQFEDKNGAKTVAKASSELDGGQKVTEPVVVLVDDGSASAAEIFAAALNQSAGDKLIGKKTFGKGTVQQVLSETDKSELKITIMKWLTPNGDWIHKKGIAPTIEADYPDYAYLTPIDKTKTYKQGDSNTSVKNINAMLKALGYLQVQPSDVYDENTKNAVAKFQTDNGFTSNGETTSETATKLEQNLAKLIGENDQAYKAALKELTK